MKVNSKNFIKRLIYSFIFIFVFSLAGILISDFTSEKTAISLRSQYIDLLSPYNDCDFDYVIRGVSANQIEQINLLDSVSNSVCYHNSNATIKINNEEVDISIFSLTDDSKANMTEYSSKRVIESKTSVNENTIFIYEQFSNAYGIKLGDKIKIAGIEFEVTKIFRDNADSAVYIPNFESILKNKFSQDLSISGIYVSCSDREKFALDFLSTYKPLASQKAREDFNTQEEYDNYLADFNSKNYSTFYMYKNENYSVDLEKANNLLDESKKYSIYSGLLIGGFILFGTVCFILLNFKKIKTEIVSNGRKELNLRSAFVYSLILLIEIIVTIINLSILAKNVRPFINVKSAFPSLLYEWILLFVFIIIGFFINFMMINRKREKIKKKKAPDENCEKNKKETASDENC